MKRLLVLAAAVCVLAGCKKTPEENVEVQAEKASRNLEQRYHELEAEAENGADAAAAPYDNEADALLNSIPANGAGANMVTAR
jgi:hypothetical protein